MFSLSSSVLSRPGSGRGLLSAWVVGLLLSTVALPAEAQNPYDAFQRELSRRAERQGRAAAGMNPLLELWNGWSEAPEVTTRELERLSTSRRLTPARRAYVGALLARVKMSAGDVDGSVAAIRALGYPEAWQVVGPFENEGKRGFAEAYGPEESRNAPFDPEARWEGKEREVSWRVNPSASFFGYTNFDAVFRPYENVCGYAETIVESERAQVLSVFLGGGGAVKAWWNGEEILSDESYRRPDPDRHVAMVGAHLGGNRLLVKSCVTDSNWGFYARIGDASGAPASNVTFSSSITPSAGEGHGVRLPRRPLTAPLDDLEAAAEGDDASAEALENLARFLSTTGADDPAENRARQLAARAADAEPTVLRLQLAAGLAAQRGEMMRFVQRAEELAPNDPQVKLMSIRVRASSLEPASALPVIDAFLADNPGGVEGLSAALIRARVLRQLGLPQTARAQIETLAARAPNAPSFILARAEAADWVGDTDAALARRREALAIRYDDLGSRRAIIGDAVRRGENQEAKEHLAVVARLAGDRTSQLRYVAAIQEAIGDTAEAQSTFRAALELAPEDASTMVSHGRFLLRQNQSDAAIASFRDALEIRPQDAATRELLENVRPQERPDERYAATSETFLGRRSETAGYPLSVLQDLTVNTVFENGLGSSFRQVAIQVHDEEGARQMRTYSMQFDPGAQRLDLRSAKVFRASGQVLEATQTFTRQLGEPWYRIYYDTRALVVVFPDLEPGDTVELRWRTDDVAHRNLFADYYGDLTFLQGTSPIAHKEYVLITPSSRNFHFSDPGLEGLQHQRTEEDGKRTDRFVADDVPAIRAEQGMPGMTEIAPYLHVSTYETWEEVGHWYWGLIQDQLYADDSLKQTVAELVDGKESERDKVIAIHDWVVANTRYVGLEFGIHGFKPYRVPQIVQRGFGDCKDKASLLYTMFREAGIDAHIILVRTRRNGQITDLPASLAVFDHAIAYVPGLDLYIDGTAEHSGITELPQMDQGVTVLHVWPTGSELRRTPILPADRNRRTRNLDIRLAADGSADLTVSEEVRGAQAASYRNTYAAEGTREERFERRMRGMFPGLELTSQRFENLDNLEVPVTYQYEARVPQMAQNDGEGLTIAPSTLQDLVRSMARNSERGYPLDLGGTNSYVEERVVRVPAGHRATRVPESGTAESPFGTLRMTVESDGERVETRTEFSLNRDRVEPGEYEAFRGWVQAADVILRQRVRIEGAN